MLMYILIAAWILIHAYCRTVNNIKDASRTAKNKAERIVNSKED